MTSEYTFFIATCKANSRKIGDYLTDTFNFWDLDITDEQVLGVQNLTYPEAKVIFNALHSRFKVVIVLRRKL